MPSISQDDTPEVAQLPQFLWGPHGSDEDDDVPAYQAVPLDETPPTQVPKSYAASLGSTASKDSLATSSDNLSILSVDTDRSSMTSTSATSIESTGHENAERDSPVMGTSANRIEDVTQTPVFAQLKAAQTGAAIQTNSSVYTFGRRLATCKFFRPTKGYGFLNDIKPVELGFQDVMVHATELYGPRNARIQSLARGELVEYTLVWAQHRGFYAVSVTGPGAVPVIGDAACNNGSIAYGRVSGASPATARPPMTLAAAANAPILGNERNRPPGLQGPLGPPLYDHGDNVQTSSGVLSPTFSAGGRSPLASPSLASPAPASPGLAGLSSLYGGAGSRGQSPLPSPRTGGGWPTSYQSPNTPANSHQPTVEQLMEQNQLLMRRLALYEGKNSLAPSPPVSTPNNTSSIWGPVSRHNN